MKSLLKSWASSTASRRCSAMARISSSVYNVWRFSSMRLRTMRMISSTLTSSPLISKLMRSVSQRRGQAGARAGIDDPYRGRSPQRHRDEQRPVGEQDLGGAPALLFVMHEVKIAEDAVQHEWDRPGQPRRPELVLRLLRGRVHGV